MNRVSVAALILVGSLAFTGCATKKHVAKETAPLINKTNELDDLTAKTTRDIKDLDARATKGIADVNTKADAADQKAASARQAADAANELATKASTGVETLTNQVVNLDNYRPVAETSVHFGFDKAELSKKAKEASLFCCRNRFRLVGEYRLPTHANHERNRERAAVRNAMLP